MKLYLVRHGNAVGGIDDVARPLSREGIDEVKKVADFLKKHDCQPQVIYHSVRLRAKQTAEIIHQRLKVKKLLLERSGLSPDDPVAEIADFVDEQKDDCMFVGHMPFMGHLVSLLVSGEENRNLVAFPTGGVAVLEKKNSGPWLITGMIDPKIL
jgi:phosphohistidine phosphatase